MTSMAPRLSLTLLLAGLAARPAQAATKVACVGDSITLGYLTTGGNNYPALLGRLLGAGYDVRNFGSNGKTMMKDAVMMMSYWDTTSFSDSKSFGPDVVVIMLGTNDSKTDNWQGGNNRYEIDYRAMIAEYATLPSRPRIYAALPPPALSTSFTVSPTVIAN